MLQHPLQEEAGEQQGAASAEGHKDAVLWLATHSLLLVHCGTLQPAARQCPRGQALQLAVCLLASSNAGSRTRTRPRLFAACPRKAGSRWCRIPSLKIRSRTAALHPQDHGALASGRRRSLGRLLGFPRQVHGKSRPGRANLAHSLCRRRQTAARPPQSLARDLSILSSRLPWNPMPLSRGVRLVSNAAEVRLRRVPMP